MKIPPSSKPVHYDCILMMTCSCFDIMSVFFITHIAENKRLTCR